jgi:hypothetical protein
VTTINGKYLYKPNSTVSPKLITGKAYTVWYSSTGDCFFIKASATGNTISSHVLAGDGFSTDYDIDQIGTMPINGELNNSLNCGESFNIPLGYTEGGTITANSLASQTVATATSNKILNGETAWISGIKITGNIPSKTAQNYKPTTTNQVISSGQYISEPQIILGYNDLISENIVKDKIIGDVVGNVIPALTYTGSCVTTITAGNYTTTADLSSLIPLNLDFLIIRAPNAPVYYIKSDSVVFRYNTGSTPQRWEIISVPTDWSIFPIAYETYSATLKISSCTYIGYKFT